MSKGVRKKGVERGFCGERWNVKGREGGGGSEGRERWNVAVVHLVMVSVAGVEGLTVMSVQADRTITMIMSMYTICIF